MAQNVDTARKHLVEPSDDISFDNGLVDLDLLPFGLTYLGSFLLILGVFDQPWRLLDRPLELRVLGGAVGDDAWDLKLRRRVLKLRIEAKELEVGTFRKGSLISKLADLLNRSALDCQVCVAIRV